MHIIKYLSNQLSKHRNPKSISGIDTSESSKRSLHVLIKENSFIFSFIFTGIMLFIILSIIPVRYESNDEFRMITILSGNGGFPSSPDVYYLNPILSYVLYILYKISPYFPWFGVFLYVVYYIGWTLILSVILRTNDRFSFILTIPILFYFFFFHSSYASFTSASLFLSFGVFLCTVEYFIRNEAPIKNIRIYFLFLAVCFYLSFLLRWKLVLYSLFLFLPMVVFIKKGQIKKILPILLLLGLVMCLNMGFNHFVYLSHQTYYDFDKLRIEFHDTHRGDFDVLTTPYALQKARWEYNDYLVFRGLWFMHDNYTFNTTNLKTFLMENNPRKTISCLFRQYFQPNNKKL